VTAKSGTWHLGVRARPKAPWSGDGLLTEVPFTGERRWVSANQVKHEGPVPRERAKPGEASCRPAGAGEAVPGARLRVSDDGSSFGEGSSSSGARVGARGVNDPGGSARSIPHPPRAYA